MKIFYSNQIDPSTVVFTPSSEVSTLPSTNVAHEFRKRVWRTGASVAAETLVWDLGSAKSISAIILLDHTLTAADSLIKLEGNTANVWGAPAFTQSLTWASGTIGQTFATQSYRYWRLSFTKSAAGQSRDIGRIFLGDYYTTTEQPDYEGYDDELDDMARKVKTLGGQTYTEQIDKFYKLTCQFSRSPDAQLTSLKTIFDSIGEAVSFFVQVDTVSPLDKFWYVKLGSAFKRKVVGYDSALFWDITLKFEEQL